MRYPKLNLALAASLATALTVAAASAEAAGPRIVHLPFGPHAAVLDDFTDADLKLTDPGSVSALNPAMGLAPNGTSTIAWNEIRGLGISDLKFIRKDAAGFVLAQKTLATSASVASGPFIATSTTGESVIAWTESISGKYRGKLVRVSARNAVSAAINATPASLDAYVSGIGLSRSGTAVLGWASLTPGSVRVEATRVDARNRVAAPLVLSDPDNGTKPPSIAVSADGTAIVTWRASIDLSHTMDHYARLDSAGRKSKTVRLTPTSELWGDPRVAADPFGRFLIGFSDEGGDMLLNPIDSSGKRGTAIILPKTVGGLGRYSVAPPTIAGSPLGGFSIAWATFTGAVYGSWTVRIDAAGHLTEPTRNSTDPSAIPEIAASVSRNGTTTLVWTQYDGIAGKLRLMGRRIDALGRQSTSAYLSDDTYNVLNAPIVSTASGGRSLIVWGGISANGWIDTLWLA